MKQSNFLFHLVFAFSLFQISIRYLLNRKIKINWKYKITTNNYILLVLLLIYSFYNLYPHSQSILPLLYIIYLFLFCKILFVHFFQLHVTLCNNFYSVINKTQHTRFLFEKRFLLPFEVCSCAS